MRLFLAFGLLLAGCGSITPDVVTGERTTFWESFQFDESMEEVTRVASIRELGAKSDAVVSARVTGMRTSRVIQATRLRTRSPWCVLICRSR